MQSSAGHVLWLLLIATGAAVVESHDGAAATITVGVLLLLLLCCTSICCLSGVGLYALCRGGVKDYDAECDEARERREME